MRSDEGVLPQTHYSVRGRLIEPAVYGLDRWLRQRQGVSEFTDDPDCLFRIQPAKLDSDVVLGDGTCLLRGAAIVNLHLWNEHMPPIGPGGATMKWGRVLARRLDMSLRQLSAHLRRTPSLREVAALRADMRLGDSRRCPQLTRIVGYCGFEPAVGLAEPHGAMQRVAENAYIMLLVLASNPGALRAQILRRDHALVYLSRSALEERYRHAAAQCPPTL